jgi:hypothetical protein
MINRIFPLSLLLGAAVLGCTKKIDDPSVSAAATIESPIIPHTEPQKNDSSTGIMTYKISAKDGGEIAPQSNAYTSDTFSQTKVTILPGALSGDAEISIFEATPIVNSIIASSLNLTTATAAGPTVAIEAGESAINTYLEIEIPYAKNGSYSLLQNEQFIVIGVIKNGDQFDAESFVGDELDIGDHTIKLKIKKFGAYQVAKITEVPTKTTAKTSAGYASRAEAEQSGASQYQTYYALSDAQLPGCDATRVSQLFYIISSQSFKSCNGQDWVVILIQGPKGDKGDAGSKGDPGTNAAALPGQGTVFEDSDKGTCVEVIENMKTISRCSKKYYDAFGGKLVRTCYTDNWQESAMANGVYNYSKSYGDSGCLLQTSRYSYCDMGYDKSADNNSCVSTCNAQNSWSCSEAQCSAQGMTWESGNKGGCLGICSSSNYWACLTSNQCTGVGGIWEGACRGCDQNNLSACTTQNLCEDNGLTWANAQCLGRCDGNNLAACTTIASCQDRNLAWDVNHCAVSCPLNKINSSRGCELPMTACTSLQRIVDNSCVNINYTEISSSLSGSYNVPIRITGNVVITNSVVFNQELVIDPGVTVSFDGPHSFYANVSLVAEGTSGAPIVFKNDTLFFGTWNKLEINNVPSEGVLRTNTGLGEFVHGTRLSYVTIDNTTGSLRLSGHYSHLTLNGSASFELVTGVLRNSAITTGQFTSGPYWYDGITMVNNNTISSGNCLIQGQIAAFKNSFTCSSGIQVRYSDWPLLFGLNSLGDSSLSCDGNPEVYLLGNSSSGVGAFNPNACIDLQNSTVLSTDSVVFVASIAEGGSNGGAPFDAKVGESIPVTALVIDPVNGLQTSISPTWEAKYAVSGSPTYLTPPTGLMPDLIFSIPENYEIGVTAVTGKTIFGKTSTLLSIGN